MAKEKNIDESQEKSLIEVSPNLPRRHVVVLKRDHTDNGINYKAGQKITVDDSTLSFLVLHNIIEIKNRG